MNSLLEMKTSLSQKIIKTYKEKILWIPVQEKLAVQSANASRKVYNLCREQRETAYQRTFTSPSYAQQCLEITECRKENPWLAEVPSQILQQAAKDCDTSYQRFFQGISNYPQWRRKYQNESFRFPQGVKNLRRVGKRSGMVYLPKFGDVCFRWSQKILGELLTTTVVQETDGWFLCLTCEITLSTLDARDLYSLGFRLPPESKIPVGIDRGCLVGAYASTGKLYHLPTLEIIQLEKEIAYRQSKLKNKQKGSKNYKKERTKIAQLHRQIFYLADNGHHQTSNQLANNHSIVCLESLKIPEMTASAQGTLENPGKNVKAKSGLNKSILRQRWGKLERLVKYKLSWRGGLVLKIPSPYTSTTCFACRYNNSRNRKGQIFRCQRCPWTCHADYNAALNILFSGMVKFLSLLLILSQPSLTAGLAGIACGDAGSLTRSMKQETLGSESRCSEMQLRIPRL